MPYCSRCGVEVEPAVLHCPLCQAPIQHFSNPSGDRQWINPEEDQLGRLFASPEIARGRAFLLIVTLLIMAASVILVVDLLDGPQSHWSPIPLTALGSAFLITAMAFRFYRSFTQMTLSLMVISLGFLGTLDFLTGVRWFFPLGLPILLGLQALFMAEYQVIKRSRVRGYNVPGFLLIGVALFCLWIDLWIGIYLGSPKVTWSLIVAVSVGPSALFFLVLHYGLKKILDLHRIFHF